MAKNEKKAKKSSRVRDSDKKMKTLSKAVAKQVSVFYKEWLKTAELNSLRKAKP